MSLYVRIETSFYSHRKTLRLRAAIGDDAFWVPPRLWSYAAANQPDGNFADYTAQELANLIDYRRDAKAMLEALLGVRFLDADPLRIHDWHEYNGILDFFSKRAKKAADARWKKAKQIGSEHSTADQSRADQSRSEASNASSNASSIDETSLKHYHKDTRAALFILNEACGKKFRETDPNLTVISQRLREPGVDIDGVRQMILRQCKRWLNTDQSEYLRPETLFGKTKFDGYYAARGQPIAVNGTPKPEANRLQEHITPKML